MSDNPARCCVVFSDGSVFQRGRSATVSLWCGGWSCSVHCGDCALGLTSRAHASYSSHDGRMPIHLACATTQHTPFTVEIVLLLLGSGSRSMATATASGTNSGRQPIHYVVARENHNEVRV
jgi:hypothetical protein